MTITRVMYQEWVMANQIKRLNARLQRAKDRLLKIPVVQLISRTAEGSGNHDICSMVVVGKYCFTLFSHALLAFYQ